MRTVLRIFATIIVLLAFTGTYWITSMVIDRTPPIIYESAKALQATVPQGGSLDIEYKVFRTRICPAVAKRWLVDSVGERHSIPSYTVGLQFLAGRETYQRSITIPDAAAIGPAFYEVDLDYSCTLVNRLGFPIHVVSPPITFIITPAEG